MPKQFRNEVPHNSKCYAKNCKYCEKEFFSTKPFTKYCSDKCRVYFNQAEKLRKVSNVSWAIELMHSVRKQIENILKSEKHTTDQKLTKAIAIITKGTRNLKKGKPA